MAAWLLTDPGFFLGRLFENAADQVAIYHWPDLDQLPEFVGLFDASGNAFPYQFSVTPDE